MLKKFTAWFKWFWISGKSRSLCILEFLTNKGAFMMTLRNYFNLKYFCSLFKWVFTRFLQIKQVYIISGCRIILYIDEEHFLCIVDFLLSNCIRKYVWWVAFQFCLFQGIWLFDFKRYYYQVEICVSISFPKISNMVYVGFTRI